MTPKPWNSTLNRTTPLRSNSELSRNTPMKKANRKRKKKNRERAYGPPERRKMVTRMACCVPGCYRQSENAHIETKGMGIKADADRVANICGRHHRTHTDSLHNLGSVERFRERWGVDLEQVARDVEAKWQEKMAEQGEPTT